MTPKIIPALECVVMPLVSQDQDGCTTLEWWVGDRKITMYPQDGMLLKVWGTEAETEEVQLQNTSDVRSAFAWLGHNDSN